MMSGLLAVLAATCLCAPAIASVDALTTQRVARDLHFPVYVCAPPGDARLFIVEQTGRIRISEDGQLRPIPFLDVGTLLPDVTGEDERGLLGLTFHPDYRTNRFFYVNYTDRQGRTVVARYTTLVIDPHRADPASALEILRIDQPYANHNGGCLQFGPDGYLYIGMGDGGAAGDPENRAQNPLELLGKLLRIDVDVETSPSRPYSIPPDNPFVGSPGARPEIFALGLRNPWRFSFDRGTGDLWIGDVGQRTREEVDLLPSGTSGQNFGWRLMEGDGCYEPPSNCDPGGLTAPVWVYPRASGGSITGGYIYRGSLLPELSGTYFFADYVSNRIWSFRFAGGAPSEFAERTSELDPVGTSRIAQISSFGEDGFGELYIVDRGFGTSGEVYKLVPGEPPDSVETTPIWTVGAPTPNPFRDSTRIPIRLERSGPLSADILDVAGRQVRGLAAGPRGPGQFDLTWDGRNVANASVPAGSYILRVRFDGLETRRPVRVVR